MTKRALTILIAAVVAVGGATAVAASTMGGDDGAKQPVHTLPSGGTHTGPMPSGEETPGMDMSK